MDGKNQTEHHIALKTGKDLVEITLIETCNNDKKSNSSNKNVSVLKIKKKGKINKIK